MFILPSRRLVMQVRDLTAHGLCPPRCEAWLIDLLTIHTQCGYARTHPRKSKLLPHCTPHGALQPESSRPASPCPCGTSAASLSASQRKLHCSHSTGWKLLGARIKLWDCREGGRKGGGRGRETHIVAPSSPSLLPSKSQINDLQ